jgi:hypothetical protein
MRQHQKYIFSSDGQVPPEALKFERDGVKGYLQWRCLYCKLNLPDIFASIESPRRQTSKGKVLAAVGFPKRVIFDF